METVAEEAVIDGWLVTMRHCVRSVCQWESCNRKHSVIDHSRLIILGCGTSTHLELGRTLSQEASA